MDEPTAPPAAAPVATAAPSVLAPPAVTAPPVAAAPAVDVAALQAQIAAQAKAIEAATKKASDLEAHAKIGEQYVERETARINEAKKGLTAKQQEIVDALPTIELKSSLIASYAPAATAAPVTPPATPIAAGGPPPIGGVDIDGLMRAGMSVSEVKRKHPHEWAAKVGPLTPNKGPKTALGALFAHKA